MVRCIAKVLAREKQGVYNDPRLNKRRRDKMYRRRKRFKEDPERVLNHRAWKFGV